MVQYNKNTTLEQREILSDYVEQVSRTTAVGSLNTAVTRAFYGINHRQTPGALPRKKESFGLTFFTRPRLNLTRDNIRFSRDLMRLATSTKNSIPNAIRCLLDPELQQQNPRHPIEPTVHCDLVDPRGAFIPLLTNTLESVSGWPNMTAFTYTSPEGPYKESMSWVDGPVKNRTTYDIQLSFRNIIGDPVTELFAIWGHYMALVFEGKIVPRPRFMKRFEIDYHTRIFHLNLEATRRYVTRITSTIAFPLDAPTGADSNYERERIYSSANDTVSVSMRAHGMETNDPILIEEFNSAVSYANPYFDVSVRAQNYVQIPAFLLKEFNNLGYPYIDPDTYELQWWVSNDVFNAVIPPSLYRDILREKDQYESLTEPGRY